jgi:hypothetical protein
MRQMLMSRSHEWIVQLTTRNLRIAWRIDIQELNDDLKTAADEYLGRFSRKSQNAPMIEAHYSEHGDGIHTSLMIYSHICGLEKLSFRGRDHYNCALSRAACAFFPEWISRVDLW